MSVSGMKLQGFKQQRAALHTAPPGHGSLIRLDPAVSGQLHTQKDTVAKRTNSLEALEARCTICRHRVGVSLWQCARLHERKKEVRVRLLAGNALPRACQPWDEPRHELRDGGGRNASEAGV